MIREYLIRFNKTRGQIGRGAIDHVWRIFEGEKEYLVKHVKINVPCWDKVTGDGQGVMIGTFAVTEY